MKKIALTIIALFILAGTSFAGSVTLHWNKPDDSRVTGYVVLYGLFGTDVSTFQEIPVVGPDTLLQVIPDLDEGKKYSFTAVSTDSSGNRSDYSTFIDYTMTGIATHEDADDQKLGAPSLFLLEENGKQYEIPLTEVQ